MLATAIHDGNGVRDEVRNAMKLPDLDRLREEDPYTGQSIVDVPTHVIAHRSRFEFDINRGEKNAVYRTPDMAWGLDIWRGPPSEKMIERSLSLHDRFYAMMAQLLDDVVDRHGRFVLLDVHSYNHRRDGPDEPPTPQSEAPDINIGTSSMNREKWAFLLDPLMEEMRRFEYLDGHLDVRENIAFQGKGELARFVHERYADTGCSIAIEFKKIYMDEWTGRPHDEHLPAMRSFINHVAAVSRRLLDA